MLTLLGPGTCLFRYCCLDTGATLETHTRTPLQFLFKHKEYVLDFVGECWKGVGLAGEQHLIAHLAAWAIVRREGVLHCCLCVCACREGWN